MGGYGAPSSRPAARLAGEAHRRRRQRRRTQQLLLTQGKLIR